MKRVSDDQSIARSYLFAPADSEELLAKVCHAGADAVVLDLEDAVAPSRKAEARLGARRLVDLRSAFARPAIWVRLNALSGEHWRRDVRRVVAPGLVGLRVPKAESVEDLDRLHLELMRAEEHAGLIAKSVQLACTIESARGLEEARQLAQHPRVVHLCFGEADFCADVGADPREPLATLYARSVLVSSSRAAGIAPPVAPVYTLLDDAEGLRMSTLEARRLGFLGRSCIHPKQLPIIHQAFTPSAHELTEARAVVEAHERSRGGSSVDEGGRFVDAAVVRRARAVLELGRLVRPGPGAS